MAHSLGSECLVSDLITEGWVCCYRCLFVFPFFSPRLVIIFLVSLVTSMSCH